MASIEEKVESLVKDKIESLGLKLYDVEYAKEGKDYYLRIYIDKAKEQGITVEDCENVTNAINDMLDKADYIKNEYFLEVSSPGIERILKKDTHFKENIGKEVELKLFKPINGRKELSGILTNFDEDKIYITINSEENEIDRKQISQIKTKYNW